MAIKLAQPITGSKWDYVIASLLLIINPVALITIILLDNNVSLADWTVLILVTATLFWFVLTLFKRERVVQSYTSLHSYFGAYRRFHAQVLDSIDPHVAILDSAGVILEVNQAWKNFAESNCGDPSFYVGQRYTDAFTEEELSADAPDIRIAKSIADVLSGRSDGFTTEYPCHSPAEQRWFRLDVTAIAGGGAIVTHTNVTRLKR
jgi:hypothetical protein